MWYRLMYLRLVYLLLCVAAVGVVVATVTSRPLDPRQFGVPPVFVIVPAFIAGVPLSVLVYFAVLSKQGRYRTRVSIAVVAMLIGLSPLSGFAEDTLWLLFMPFYFLGEILLIPVGLTISMFLGWPYEAIVFDDHQNVSPYSLIVIWLSIAAAFGSSLLIEQVRRWRGTRHAIAPSECSPPAVTN